MPRATLNVDGHPADLEILHARFNFHRTPDPTGRPAVEIIGGEIYVDIYSTDDKSFFEWMATPQVLKTGSITFYRDDEVDAILRTLTFTDAYLTGYSESISAIGAQNMTMSLVFTARCVDMGKGGAKIEKNWPTNNRR